MTLWKPLYSRLKPFGLYLTHHLARRVRRPLVLDQLTELRAVLLRAQGPVEAAGVRHGVLYVPHLIHRPPEPLSHLLVVGLTLQLGRELVVSAGHLADRLGRVHRHPNRTPLV